MCGACIAYLSARRCTTENQQKARMRVQAQCAVFPMQVSGSMPHACIIQVMQARVHQHRRRISAVRSLLLPEVAQLVSPRLAVQGHHVRRVERCGGELIQRCLVHEVEGLRPELEVHVPLQRSFLVDQPKRAIRTARHRSHGCIWSSFGIYVDDASYIRGDTEAQDNRKRTHTHTYDNAWKL